MNAPLHITGNVRERFIQAAALLRLLDPVRGEPTAYSLDQESHSIHASRERLLKRKFLDSFALICATDKGADTVSAACLEEGGPGGTVVRIASNSGVAKETQGYLQDILSTLSSIAIRLIDTTDGEQEVLLKIIRLDIPKIRLYMKSLQKSNKVFDETIPALDLRLRKALPDTTSLPIQNFLHWFEQIFSLQHLRSNPDPDILLAWIKWAGEARKTFLSLLKIAFTNNDQSLQRWVSIVLKLGRYSIAARALVQTAYELPALFDTIVIEAIPAPSKVEFSLRDEKVPLTCTLRRIPEIKADEMVPRLARILDIQDAESFFRESCSVNLVAHAELQIINFYDHNPFLRPRHPFIGVSKKSCYLCSEFLIAHPGNFQVSSCHQKLYLAWIPPPAMNLGVYKQYRDITAYMAKKMEVIAKQELTGRLGSKRTPVPADSTAGVSFSGLAEMGSLPTINYVEHAEMETALESSDNIGEPYTVSQTRATHSHISSSVRSAIVKPQTSRSKPAGMNDLGLSNSRQLFPKPECMFSSMVFHFRHFCDENRQDIIAIRSVLDPHTHSPSWSKLIELLTSDDSLGFVFRESDVMLVNNHVRVRNERQFAACLQYLQNMSVLNSEVLICDGDSPSQGSTSS
ncbi:hypothetical protein BKA61DRAFT_497520 [Leptodontidium sp. MPI-SDFR-AT-0119]|nr:hypothetical protein BKA61DRAFT_497520 [Leptodontidium sp. MPI-SDFR-AT-0119]